MDMNCKNCGKEIPLGVSFFEDCCQQCVDWEAVSPEDHYVLVDMDGGVTEKLKYGFKRGLCGFFPVNAASPNLMEDGVIEKIARAMAKSDDERCVHDEIDLRHAEVAWRIVNEL